MIVSFRRPHIRYLLALAALVAIYVVLLPWNPGYEAVANTAGQLARFRKPSGFDAALEYARPSHWTSSFKDDSNADPGSPSSEAAAIQVKNRAEKARRHYQEVFNIFARNTPQIEKLKNYKNDERAKKKAFTDKVPVYTNEELAEFLQVSDGDLTVLRSAHRATVGELPSTPPSGLYKGQGIVTIGGGRYTPVLLTTLRMLRRVSPRMPIEVFLSDESEYEKDMCEKVLPDLNARCVLLSDVYGKDVMNRHDIRGYQYKVLSILGSSFEDVIFIDSDSVPLYDIETLVLREPFTTYGYVLWPDFWFRTTSPAFYDIADIKLGERVRGNLSETDPKLIPQADRKGALPDKSTESGQIIISKARHYKSLLLSVYYNLNGYKAYYPLFSQGSGGEGDKETYLAAAEVLGEKYYQVKQDTRPTGRFQNGEFVGAGMLQMHPFDDYLVNTVGVTENVAPRVLFMHLNYPKVNPRELFGNDGQHFDESNEAKRVRYYGKPSEQSHLFNGKDIEQQLWQECKWQACTLGKDQGIVADDWKDEDITEMCRRISVHLEWLDKTHNS